MWEIIGLHANLMYAGFRIMHADRSKKTSLYASKENAGFRIKSRGRSPKSTKAVHVEKLPSMFYNVR